jgi:predicted nuclease of restriction endonuclease-like (RecB) superfamily
MVMTGKRSGNLAKRRERKAVLGQPARELARSPVSDNPIGYPALLEDIKNRIRTAQIKAALSVNREMIELYWSIGRDIVARQRIEGWGQSIIERLAADLSGEFPGIGSISARNIWYARAFYLAYEVGSAKLKQPVSEMGRDPILKQPVSELDSEKLPNVLAAIPWGHNIVLIQRLKSVAQRFWYAEQTVTNGWSRSVLLHWIESDLYSRQGKSINNFKDTLPAPQSDLANQLIKDPYTFDFLTLATNAAERELEEGLLAHIRKFLIELGGFAFVGQQVPFEVEGDDFSIGLLFYQLRLRCYVVIDLKVQAFKPEFADKMNFYLSTVDDQMRHGDDKPSIGLILCKTRKKTVVEYALRDLVKPIGVARYVTKLVESLPEELAGVLPSIEQIEAELAKG